MDSLSLRLPAIGAFVDHQIIVRASTGLAAYATAFAATCAALAAGVSATFVVRTHNVVRNQREIALRQADIAAAQAAIAERQISLAEEARRERIRRAVGRFYRTAFELESEFRKTNSIEVDGDRIVVDEDAHPRQVLRNASEEFAPLGDRAVQLLNEVGLGLDEFYVQMSAWNEYSSENRVLTRIRSIDNLRRQIGQAFDEVNSEMPAQLRVRGGTAELDFEKRFTRPGATV